VTARKPRGKQQLAEGDASLVTISYPNNSVQINSNLVPEGFVSSRPSL